MKLIHPNVFNGNVQQRGSDTPTVVARFLGELFVVSQDPLIPIHPVIVFWLRCVPAVEINIIC